MRRATRRSTSAKWPITYERTARPGGALLSPRVRPALRRADPVPRRALPRLDLVEDVVQAALVQALETWSQRGVPEDPAGSTAPPATWRSTRCGGSEPTPRPLPRLATPLTWGSERESSPLEAHFADEIGDEPQRLLFCKMKD
jgi:predicted RNA polymerase sigma factor